MNYAQAKEEVLEGLKAIRVTGVVLIQGERELSVLDLIQEVEADTKLGRELVESWSRLGLLKKEIRNTKNNRN